MDVLVHGSVPKSQLKNIQNWKIASIRHKLPVKLLTNDKNDTKSNESWMLVPAKASENTNEMGLLNKYLDI